MPYLFQYVSHGISYHTKVLLSFCKTSALYLSTKQKEIMFFPFTITRFSQLFCNNHLLENVSNVCTRAWEIPLTKPILSYCNPAGHCRDGMGIVLFSPRHSFTLTILPLHVQIGGPPEVYLISTLGMSILL